MIERGLADLNRREESEFALLVSIGAPRLSRAGVPVPSPFQEPEHRLYGLLAAQDPRAAHSRYNAYIRRLVSFERALECGRP